MSTQPQLDFSLSNVYRSLFYTFIQNHQRISLSSFFLSSFAPFLAHFYAITISTSLLPLLHFYRYYQPLLSILHIFTHTLTLTLLSLSLTPVATQS